MSDEFRDAPARLEAATAEIDAAAARQYHAYHYGEDIDLDDDWVFALFPDGLPLWAALVLETAVAGNRICLMQCIRCQATGAPLQPEQHEQRCDYRQFERAGSLPGRRARGGQR